MRILLSDGHCQLLHVVGAVVTTSASPGHRESVCTSSVMCGRAAESVSAAAGSLAAVAADVRAAMLDERPFGTVTIRCEVYDGVTDYRAPHKRGQPSGAGGGGGAAEAADEAPPGVSGDAAPGGEEEENLDAFGDWLEADSTDEELAPGEDDG